MGRLFWKFFFFIWLAQLTGIAATSATFWLEHRTQDSRPDSRGQRPPEHLRHAPDGRRPPPPRGLLPGARPPGKAMVPAALLVATLLASLIFAALLAWYFAKPIRSLRSAFEAMVGGNLDVRLEPVMGKRHDELADLGRNFDRMVIHLNGLIEGQQRLLHDVSHELRSPLARLQAAVGLARQQPEKLESSLQRIERECERMDRLVGELLTLSRLEAGMTSGMEESVDIDELVADVICDARFEAESSGHGVDFSGVSALSVKGNAELLHRAFENVVRNALKHSPEDGRIRVEASRSGNGGNFHLAVLDHGSGVPDKYLEAIFEPFFRAGGSRSGDGHGLGLAITRRVIEAHGGKVFATNRPEGGLSIEIELPTELSVP